MTTEYNIIEEELLFYLPNMWNISLKCIITELIDYTNDRLIAINNVTEPVNNTGVSNHWKHADCQLISRLRSIQTTALKRVEIVSL